MEPYSQNNKLIIDLSKLHDIKNIKEKGLFLVEGEHLVNEAYSAKRLIKCLYQEGVKHPNVDAILCSEQAIKKLSLTKTPQGIVGVCSCNNDFFIEGNILILDGISDPGNMGTIIRTALAFGIKTIVCSKDTVSIYNDKVVRATQGAIFKINILYTDLVEFIDKIKKDGYQVLATSLKATNYITDLHVNDLFALVIGNEANGVRQETLNASTDIFKIQMKGDMESLNASIATAICIWELTK